VKPALLIVNPTASRVTPELVRAVEDELRARGPVETVLTEYPGHAVSLAEDGCRTCERLYVFSGDGGFNEAVNGLDGLIPVGFVPGGGTSVLPRALGLPRDPVACATTLARSDERRRISLGRVTYSAGEEAAGAPPPSRRFTFSAGLGLDAELVRTVDGMGRVGGVRPGDLAFLGALLRAIARRRGRFEPGMTVLGRRRVAFAVVANGSPYTFLGRVPVQAAPAARFELGLDLVAPERLGPTRLPGLAISVLGRPRHTRTKDILYLHDADEIRVECDVATPLQVDGEDLGDATDVVFEAEREALDVLVPGKTDPA
jgi:diacylglycerol kinase family enzyme